MLREKTDKTEREVSDLNAAGAFDTAQRRGQAELSNAAVWVLVGLVLFLLGNSAYSLFDRDEPRFAEASRFMSATGDWIVPQFNGNLRPDKPIFIYWLMGGAMRWLGPNEFAARLFPALAGALTLGLIYCFARRLGASRTGSHAACALLALSPLFLVVSKSAITDSVVTLTVVGALFLYWENARVFRWWRHLAFWAVVALSALTKGPPGLLVMAGTAGGWCGWNRWRPIEPGGAVPTKDLQSGASQRPGWFLRLLSGLVVFLAIGLPWACAVWMRTQGEFFRVAIGHHVVDRMAQPLEGHSGPFFFYIPVLMAALLPFWGAMIPALRGAWQDTSKTQVRFLWSWIWPALVVFSSVRTKLPHYITPLLPALALMVGLEWKRLGQLRLRRGWRVGVGLVQLLLGAAVAALLVALPLRYQLPGLLAPAVAVGGLFAIAIAVFAFGSSLRVWAGSSLVLFACYGLAFTWLLPVLEQFRPSKSITTWLHHHSPPGTRLAAVEYHEPSLVFYWQDQVMMLGNSQGRKAMELLGERSTPTALLVPLGKWKSWLAQAGSQAGATMRECYRQRFFVPTRGRWDELVVIANFDEVER